MHAPDLPPSDRPPADQAQAQARRQTHVLADAPADAPASPAPACEAPGPDARSGWAGATEARLTALEEKACYSDDLLEHLNRQVAEQQAQIELLLRELLRLRQHTSAAQPEGFRSLRDELPPHY